MCHLKKNSTIKESDIISESKSSSYDITDLNNCITKLINGGKAIDTKYDLEEVRKIIRNKSIS